MTTSIAFNDGSAATLVNGQNAPADRFSNWTPRPIPVGQSANPQASPLRTLFLFRTDYVVSFSLEKITSSGANSNMTVAARLIAHLLKGNTCTVNTGDAASSSYTMGLAPGTTPSLTLTDRVNMEYTLALDLVNTGSAALPVCRYAG